MQLVKDPGVVFKLIFYAIWAGCFFRRLESTISMIILVTGVDLAISH